MDEILHSWKSLAAKECNRILCRKGQFWQEDYFDRFICDVEHYWRAKRYIEENPVKAGLVKTPQAWVFGNAGFMRQAGGTPAPPGVKPLSAAAKELNELRENWLNPPDWTRLEVMEFPGTVCGPWDRYILKPETRNLKPGDVATVRYPRLVARDADCAARLKERTLTKLYNERPPWLADCHARLDAAVVAAYGWPAEMSDEQVLERLLALNVSRSTAGVHPPSCPT